MLSPAKHVMGSHHRIQYRVSITALGKDLTHISLPRLIGEEKSALLGLDPKSSSERSKSLIVFFTCRSPTASLLGFD